MAWVYSHEALPNPEMIGRPGYTPDSEYVRWAGIIITIPARKWTRLPESWPMLIHRDWRDKAGTEFDVPASKFKAVITRGRFAQRGVLWVEDPLPGKDALKELEALSEKVNMQWRKEQVQWYEDQVREKEVTGHGRSKPTPYEDECYEALGMKKPYSADAIQAQRDPGAAVAKAIQAAIEAILAKQEKKDEETRTVSPSPGNKRNG